MEDLLCYADVCITMDVKTNNSLSGKPLDCKIFTITVKFKVCGRRSWFIRNPVGQWTRKAKPQVIRSPFQSSWKPRSIPCSSSSEINPMFHFQLNGEALWRLREVCGQPSTVFQLLQLSILPLGYRLMESAGERVGRALADSREQTNMFTLHGKSRR